MKQERVKIYAKALAEIFSKKLSVAEEKKFIDNFVKLLFTSGYNKKSKNILDMAENLILKKQGKKRVLLETARKIEQGKMPEYKKMLGGFISKGDVVVEKINSELIAGIKIIINDSQQFDSSLQSKLRNIK